MNPRDLPKCNGLRDTATIQINGEPRTIPFESVNRGEWFRLYGTLYLKVNSYQCYNFSENKLCDFSCEYVTPVTNVKITCDIK